MRKTHLVAAAMILAAMTLLAADAQAYYHPGMGRFLSRDPGGGIAMRVGTSGPAVGGGFLPRDQYADGMNLYQYVRSQPVCRSDPLGLLTFPQVDFWTGKKTIEVSPDGVRTLDLTRRGRQGVDGWWYTAKTDRGRDVELFQPQTANFNCHALTFGANTAPGGPFYIYNDQVTRILTDDGWQAVPCCDADPGDILVFWEGDQAVGDPVHSGIISRLSLEYDGGEVRIIEEQSMLRQKLGSWIPPDQRKHEEEIQGEHAIPVPSVRQRGVVALSWSETATLAETREKYPGENWTPGYGEYRCFRSQGRDHYHDHNKCCVPGKHEIPIPGKHKL